jgi:hypothetical protein
MKLKEIATEINDFLKGFESSRIQSARGGPRYYCAGAGVSGRYVWVKYIAYQRETYLNREDAEKYLLWLRAGNEGRHWEGLRDK